jgi:tellurite resistance protein TehA-like permease
MLSGKRSFTNAIADLQALHPGNFAMVMASGIVSVGLANLGFEVLAELLYYFAVFIWLSLLVLSTARAVVHFSAVRVDLLNPRMVFSYFTLVAATAIVGLLWHAHGHVQLAILCWWIAFLSWSALLYLSFSVLTFLTHEHNVNIVHGGWLISIVGTQSLVLLGARIAPELGPYSSFMMIEIHMLWGLGLAFYGIFVTLFCYRIFFLTLKPDQVSPLLWVVMGAAAICANAGTSLLTGNPGLPFLVAQRPFIEGISMMIWAWATWWIPMLVLFFVWKHLIHKLPLRYEPILWSFVFPLGMYAVASGRLGLAAEFSPLEWISKVMVWIAFAAWCFTLIGFLHQMVRTLRRW